MYILLPYIIKKKETRNLKEEGFSFGALSSSVGNLNFTGQDGVFSQLSKGMNEVEGLNSKFSIVSMTQMLRDGKVGNQEALDYMFEGMAPQLGAVQVAQGYQSLGVMKTALSSGNFNATTFLKGLGSSFDSLTLQSKTANINKEKAILIDVVSSESWTRQQETADRRVQAGATLSDLIHNLPEMFNFECEFIEGENYTREEFEYNMNYVINRKIPVSLVVDDPILGENLLENLVIMSYSPVRSSPISGFTYEISFKKISIGSFETKKIVIESLGDKTEANIVNNPVDQERAEKTQEVDNRGSSVKLVEGASGIFKEITQ